MSTKEIEHALFILEKFSIEPIFDNIIVSGNSVFTGMINDDNVFETMIAFGEGDSTIINNKFYPKEDKEFPINTHDLLISKVQDVLSNRTGLDVDKFKDSLKTHGVPPFYRITIVGLNDCMMIDATSEGPKYDMLIHKTSGTKNKLHLKKLSTHLDNYFFYCICITLYKQWNNLKKI